MNDVEREVRRHYDSQGWVEDETGKTGEDHDFRPFQDCSRAYYEAADEKLIARFRGQDGVLLIAGCGDAPQSHVKIAGQFQRFICLDISVRALAVSARKLGARGEFVNGSLLDIPLGSDRVDAILCTHVLYHIDRDRQARAVEEMIRVLRPGGRAVIVYTNPRAPLNLVQRALKAVGLNRLLGKDILYFYGHPLSWWRRFGGDCDLAFEPALAMTVNQQRALVPDNRLGRALFNWAARFEDRHPGIALRLWSYPTVILRKPSA
ncbi:MAG: class I SAM-dependent methyltransferase [Alphaproteobacteria bacterium]|nr:class I SAM-dependent methyltransferase [Alphaproteobacteria bacterium]